MKVLKQTDTNSWRLKILCNKCDSELEADKYDLLCEVDDCAVQCPVCNEIIDLEAAQIPKAVQVEVEMGKTKKRPSSSLSDDAYWDDQNKITQRREG